MADNIKKTEYLKLYEWVGTDRPLRKHFVADNLILDKKFKELSLSLNTYKDETANRIDSLANNLFPELRDRIASIEANLLPIEKIHAINNLINTNDTTVAKINDYGNQLQNLTLSIDKLSNDYQPIILQLEELRRIETNVKNIVYNSVDRIVTIEKNDETIDIDLKYKIPKFTYSDRGIVSGSEIDDMIEKALAKDNIVADIDDKIKNYIDNHFMNGTRDDKKLFSSNEIKDMINAKFDTIPTYGPATNTKLGLVTLDTINNLIGNRTTGHKIIEKITNVADYKRLLGITNLPNKQEISDMVSGIIDNKINDAITGLTAANETDIAPDSTDPKLMSPSNIMKLADEAIDKAYKTKVPQLSPQDNTTATNNDNALVYGNSRPTAGKNFDENTYGLINIHTIKEIANTIIKANKEGYIKSSEIDNIIDLALQQADLSNNIYKIENITTDVSGKKGIVSATAIRNYVDDKVDEANTEIDTLKKSLSDQAINDKISAFLNTNSANITDDTKTIWSKNMIKSIVAANTPNIADATDTTKGIISKNDIKAIIRDNVNFVDNGRTDDIVSVTKTGDMTFRVSNRGGINTDITLVPPAPASAGPDTEGLVTINQINNLIADAAANSSVNVPSVDALTDDNAEPSLIPPSVIKSYVDESTKDLASKAAVKLVVNATTRALIADTKPKSTDMNTYVSQISNIGEHPGNGYSNRLLTEQKFIIFLRALLGNKRIHVIIRRVKNEASVEKGDIIIYYSKKDLANEIPHPDDNVTIFEVLKNVDITSDNLIQTLTNSQYVKIFNGGISTGTSGSSGSSSSSGSANVQPATDNTAGIISKNDINRLIDNKIANIRPQTVPEATDTTDGIISKAEIKNLISNFVNKTYRDINVTNNPDTKGLWSKNALTALIRDLIPAPQTIPNAEDNVAGIITKNEINNMITNKIENHRFGENAATLLEIWGRLAGYRNN